MVPRFGEKETQEKTMNQKKFKFDSSKMKNYFITGLVILLPVALTLIIVTFLFNLLTRPFEGLMTTLIRSIGLFKSGFLFLTQDQLILYTSKLLIIIFLGALTILLGVLGRWFMLHWLIRAGEALVTKIPLISSIYKTSQDVIQTIFTSQTKSFKQVVLVPYPNDFTHSLGLITREHVEGVSGEHFKDPVAIFIPTTPNPTSGFLLLFERKDIIYVDMTIEEALKYVISCGVIMTPIRPLSKEEAEARIAKELKEEQEMDEGQAR